MEIRKIGKTRWGQDGAIFGGLLFRFDQSGLCLVYDVEKLDAGEGDAEELKPEAQFYLDKADKIVPHGNAVVFGNEFYEEGDEFPLLYSNIYNNYAEADDPLVGVCCVYRLTRVDGGFCSTLVQIIQIGFTDSTEYWRSGGGVSDVRPYGNFVVDTENSKYYAFVMRDADKTTRYFEFELPKSRDGVIDERFGVKKVTLDVCDVKSFFDVPYHNYVQGACMYEGSIYSLEGFDEEIHPVLRVIDTAQKKEVFFFDFFEAGLPIEAELIDFYRGKCYYSDYRGNTFLLEGFSD